MGLVKPPSVSVIVPAYRAELTLERCLESLLGQRFGEEFEVVLVICADRPEELPSVPDDTRLQVITHVPRLGQFEARNLGTDAARGELLAFADADILAPPDWLEQLVAAARAQDNRCCVAGGVANGTPRSLFGTIEYLVEFFDLSPARRHPVEHGGTGNLLVPRHLWERFGPFPEGMACQDTWLTVRMKEEGLLRFAGEAFVYHVNRRRWLEVLRHQYEHGRAYARFAALRDRPPAAAGRAALGALAARIRWFYTSTAMWTPRQLPRAIVLGPLLLVTFGSWAAGLAFEATRPGS